MDNSRVSKVKTTGLFSSREGDHRPADCQLEYVAESEEVGGNGVTKRQDTVQNSNEAFGVSARGPIVFNNRTYFAMTAATSEYHHSEHA